MNKDQNLLQEAYKKVQKPQSKWDKWLAGHNYEIHEDKSITLKEDVYLDESSLTEIPFNFREVKGNFFVSHNEDLTSLVGSPQIVGGHFDCSATGITSLEGGSIEVGGSFFCTRNPQLKSVKGLPKAERYHTDFSEEDIQREFYRQELESKMDPETKDVFGDLLADL